MHYTWLSVHPSTNTDMHMQEPKKLTKVIIYIYNTVVKCIYVRGLHLGLGLLHLIAFFKKKKHAIITSRSLKLHLIEIKKSQQPDSA